MRYSALQPVVIKCHIQIIYMSRQSCYPLSTTQNFSLNNTGFPVTNHTIRVIISPLCLPQRETWRARWWSITARLYPSDNEGVTDVYTYRDCLRTLHSQAVVEAKTNFVPSRVLGASPPDISPLESLLPRSVRTTLAQLHYGHCRLLNIYKARITSGISDVCPECGVATVKAIRHNLQCKTCGITRLRSQTSSTWTTDDRRRAAGLSQQQQQGENTWMFLSGWKIYLTV